MAQLPYDETSKQSIEEYGKKLIGRTFREIIEEYPYISMEDKEALLRRLDRKNAKGSLGNLIEAYHFFIFPNSSPFPDFPKAGVELKVTPFLKNGNKVKSKERLVLSMINYMKDYKYSLEENHMFKKCALMLLVCYLHELDKVKIDFTIEYVKLFEIPEKDLDIIRNDYNTIIEKIKNGKAHEISESDTNYLGACTKAADSTKLTKQPKSKILAKPRAYCLKNSYMTYILNNYIANNKYTYDSIIKNNEILKDITLESYIITTMSAFYGKSILRLKEELNIEVPPSNKAFNYHLAKAMLKVIGDKIEEFEKANIQIKTIRLNKNNTIKESMSFPTFKYNDIVNQEFEDSDLFELFSSTRFLFMIFKFNDNNELVFKKAMFWNMPFTDLDGEVRKVWNKTKEQILNNEFENLPKMKDSPILHVRPHGRNKQDVFPTPNKSFATKKCFWLHHKYILEQINESED